MDKKQFIERIASVTGDSKAAVERILNAGRDISHEELKAGGGLKLVGWFNVKSIPVAERKVRNPRTQEPMTIPAGRRITFRAAKGFGV